MADIPDKAYDVWRVVRQTGEPPEGFSGGRTFRNRERKLPEEGSYREYDIDPLPLSGSRNAERVIIDADARQAWYTSDHYQTFIQMLGQNGKGGDDETCSD